MQTVYEHQIECMCICRRFPTQSQRGNKKKPLKYFDVSLLSLASFINRSDALCVTPVHPVGIQCVYSHWHLSSFPLLLLHAPYFNSFPLELSLICQLYNRTLLFFIRTWFLRNSHSFIEDSVVLHSHVLRAVIFVIFFRA